MFKQIPKSNISQKNFKVYKEWYVDQDTSPVISAFNENNLFDLDTSTKSQGLYVHPLFNSIKSKYYSSFGNIFTQYGLMKNPANWLTERFIGDTIQIIQIPQIQYGEQIKKGSVLLNILGDDVEYSDDSWGGLITKNATYLFTSYDMETQELVITDGSESTSLTLSYFDINTGIGEFTIDGITESVTVFIMDIESGFITLSNPLSFPGDDPQANRRGNVFYDDGLIVITNLPTFTDYTLTYKSTQTIYETEVLISTEKGEFNFSQNPTAVDVTLANSYDFETTKITNYKPAGTVHIKEVQDISQKQVFSGSIGSTIGNWNDYYESGSTDPTGSYLSTFITTIGLYDGDYNMIAVAKLPTPIKKLPDYNLNFIIRFDT